MNAPACRADRQAGFARSHTADLSFLVGLNSGASTLTADGVSLAKGAFFTSGPVAVAMPVTNAFFSYSSGVFDDGESCGQAPGHAASLIGYTADAWVGMNSWGAHWGDYGGFKFATCFPTHYIVPGAITAYTLPATGPASPPTPASTPKPGVEGDSTVDGPCVTNNVGVSSLNFPGAYGNSQQ